jgi:hypothetical protein
MFLNPEYGCMIFFELLIFCYVILTEKMSAIISTNVKEMDMDFWLSFPC